MALNLGAVVMKLDGDASGLMSATNKANMALAGINRVAGNLGRQGLTSLNDGFTATANIIKTGLVVGVGAGVGALGLIGSQAIKQAGDFEIYRATLTNMLGTQEKANARLKEYAEIGAKTPFELDQVVALGNQLQAMGKYSRDNVIMLGDLASAAGKPIDQVGAAYSKLVTGQKGMAVDMFRDLLITTDDWVKATGKGVSKNGELMATTEDMLKVLPKIMANKKFSGMMDVQSQTFQGKWSNMLDSINGKLRDFGEKLLPIIKPYMDQFINLINSIDVDSLLNKFQNFAQQVIVFFTPLYNFISSNTPQAQAVLVGLGTVVGTLVVGAFVQMGIAVIGATLPFVALGLAVGGLFYLFQTNTAVRDFVTNTWNFLVDKFNYFKNDVLPIIVSKIQEFANYWGDNVKPKIDDFINQTWNKLVTAFNDFSTWVSNNKPTIENLGIVIGGLATGFGLVSGALWVWNTAVTVYNIVMGIGTIITTGFGVAVAIATSPLFLIALAIGVVIAIGLLLWKNWDWLSSKAGELMTGISNALGGIGRWFGDRFNEVKGHFQSLWEKANEIKNGIVSAFKGIQDGIGNALSGVVKALIGNINNAIGGVNNVIRNIPDIPGVGKIPQIPKIPGFRNGVTNFEGGLAYVHQDEMLMNLPKGTDVITASETKKMTSSGGNSDTPSNIYMTFNISSNNPDEVAKKVADILAKQNSNRRLGMNNAYA